MRVLLNGMPMLGRLTGVGHYARRLLHALSRQSEVEDIEIFDGARIVPLATFIQATRQRGRVERHERLKQLVRRAAPFCRPLVARFRAEQFRRKTRDMRWSLYHEPNYVSQNFSGPIVTTVCDMSYLRHPEFLPHDRLQWLRRRLRDSLERSRAVLAISEFTRHEILELCPAIDPGKVFVTPLGVDARYFQASSSEDAVRRVRARLKLPPRFVLCLGTLEPRKNLHGLLRGYERLPSSLQHAFPLVLAGTSGWKQHYFRSSLDALRRRGVLHELGYIADDDVPALMKAADVFCFPSLYEGFGLPPLEAAACGTPVVASNSSALPEVMGDAALYINPASSQSIADGLQQILEDQNLRASLATLGPRRAAQFNWERCAASTAAAYRAAA